ncbi:LytTR family transcriptional regulator [Pseudolabrys sp. Root1462]|uniref:DUF4159 domain-containing protein n=1 Tax=Pseudolabrys sp. Root1462 TaxID=1736466 RepID=UPI000702C3AA|nr:DUF4159 domain-containing protein [Pseudolabrys sp. Root1462]KQZ01866.1 LytTR family transcriptional regulator [Pseudolabrys sp. Root1462]
MIGSLPLAFAQPLILLGLLSLPLLWWLLRLVPPRPRVINFPPTRLLFEISPKEETPSRTPWWLILLRLLLATLVIFAAAGPLWNPPVATGARNGPLLIMIDDGWSAASAWDVRLRTADELLARAEADNRGVALLPLSETARDISLQVAGAARVQVKLLKPKPHAVDRIEALPLIDRFLKSSPGVEIVWLSDGVDLGKGAGFIDGLKQIAGNHPITVVSGGVPIPHALAAADNAAGALTVKVLRAQTGVSENGLVHALDLKGLPLGDAPFAFGAGDRETEATIKLPVEIRNDVARLEIAGERSAGGVQLLDKRWRRRTVGIVSGTALDRSQPLLGASYYLSRALSPFADVRLAESVAPPEAIGRFLDQRLPMLVLADVGNVAEARGRLDTWLENGGVLVRFAGPHLAAGSDDLVPVRLRRGGRILGGSLSWEKPQQLTGFSRDSPFAGMPVPNDVTVTRQVLAEPDATLADRTWATLADGTPLVTAQRRGKGLIVLFHVTADTNWSDLPLSGAFVDMLRHIVGLAGATATTEGDGEKVSNGAAQVVPPTRVLDGFGAFTVPPANARPLPTGYSGRASADHPPGFYGPPEGLVAVNTLVKDDRPAPLDFAPLNARLDVYRFGEPVDLRGPVFIAAFGLMALDALVVFWIAGGLMAFSRRRAATAALVMMALAGALAMPQPARAQSTLVPAQSLPQRQPLSPQQNDFAIKATEQTHLAYIVTGDAETDAISRAGLQGLTLFLAQRTALEPGEPVGLDPARDELSFFPLIYWPVSGSVAKPTRAALDRIDTYMKRGGTVLFDTRDAIDAPPGPDGANRSPGMVALRSILSSLDVPELEPVPRDHVLNKTFFLLKDFPGRYTNGQLWVEALPAESAEDPNRPARGGDGVSSIMITSNDLAGAWAMRPDGQPMLPLVPGEPRQREFAFRAGVNIVMYVLTGNYKADQVHIPALLERLGQ